MRVVMHQLNPIISFTRQLVANSQRDTGELSPGAWKKIAAWYAKLLCEEPFRLYERVFKGPDIARHRIERPPIFVLGHWRSGTSFLHSLLGCDPRRGYLHKYASIFPESFLSSEALLKPLVRGLTKSSRIERNISRISGEWDWDDGGEPDIAMIMAFSLYSAHWGHAFPADRYEYYMDKFVYFETATDEEESRWKETYAYLMNKVSMKNKARQLIIKSPPHTARIKQLLDLYPDAKFLYIHRNPYDVFYSNLKMWKVIVDNVSFQAVRREKIIDYILATYRKLLSRYIEHRKLIPKGNLVELYYEDLSASPIRTLKYVYNSLGLEGINEARPILDRYLQDQGNHSPSRYEYSGRILERIDAEWRFALEEWPYEFSSKPATAAGV